MRSLFRDQGRTPGCSIIWGSFFNGGSEFAYTGMTRIFVPSVWRQDGGALVVPADGWYTGILSLFFNNVNAGTQAWVGINRNGNLIRRTRGHIPTTGGADESGAHFTVNLRRGDRLTGVGFHNDGTISRYVEGYLTLWRID